MQLAAPAMQNPDPFVLSRINAMQSDFACHIGHVKEQPFSLHEALYRPTTPRSLGVSLRGCPAYSRSPHAPYFVIGPVAA